MNRLGKVTAGDNLTSVIPRGSITCSVKFEHPALNSDHTFLASKTNLALLQSAAGIWHRLPPVGPRSCAGFRWRILFRYRCRCLCDS